MKAVRRRDWRGAACVAVFAGLALLLNGGAMADNVALSFDGDDTDGDRIEVNVQGTLDSVTLEFWMLFEVGADQTWPRIFGMADGGADHEINQEGLFYRFRWLDSEGSSSEVDSEENFALDGVWAHYAITYDLETVRFYRDGVLFDEQSMSSEAAEQQLDTIGNRADTARTLLGQLAEVRVWSTALSEGDIQARMNQRLSGSEDGLLAYWPLSEGSGNTATDASGNGFDGTIVGAVWVDAPDLPLESPTVFESDLPGSIITTPGSTVTLGPVVLESPEGDVTYEWFFNDTVIAGEEGDTLVLSDVTAGDSGQYFVRVHDESEDSPYDSRITTVSVWENLPAAGVAGLALLAAAAFGAGALALRRRRG